MSISLSFSFSSNTTISSSEVNANFATLASRALDKQGDTMTGDLLFTDATYDIGKTGATRPRDLFISRNATVGGTLAVTGTASLSAATLSSTLAVTSTSTFTGAVTFSSADNLFKAGASTETFAGAGVINTDSTQLATGADTNDTTLFTYTLPASALNANGRLIRVTAYGSLGANGNTKTVRLKWNGTSGTTVVSFTGTNSAAKWMAVGHIHRTASGAQDLFGILPVTGASTDVGTNFATASATDSGAIVIAVTAQNGTASAGDITYEGSIIEFLN